MLNLYGGLSNIVLSLEILMQLKVAKLFCIRILIKNHNITHKNLLHGLLKCKFFYSVRFVMTLFEILMYVTGILNSLVT